MRLRSFPLIAQPRVVDFFQCIRVYISSPLLAFRKNAYTKPKEDGMKDMENTLLQTVGV